MKDKVCMYVYIYIYMLYELSWNKYCNLISPFLFQISNYDQCNLRKLINYIWLVIVTM